MGAVLVVQGFTLTLHAGVCDTNCHRLQDITITGSGFGHSPEEVKVVVAGLPCDVTGCSPSKLRCRLAARNATISVSGSSVSINVPPVARVHPGRNGVRAEVYEDLPRNPSALTHHIFGQSSVAPTSMITEHGWATNSGNVNHHVHFSAFWTVPYTSRYVFMMDCQEQCRVRNLSNPLL